MAIRRCPYCKAIIDESQKYCNNCGTQLLFPDDDPNEEPIKGDRIVDEDFPGGTGGRFSDLPEDQEQEKDIDEIDPDEPVEREEIDLEKVLDGERGLPGEEEPEAFVDLREAEGEPGEHPAYIESPGIAETAAPDEAAVPVVEKPRDPAEPIEPAEVEEPVPPAPSPVRARGRRKKNLVAEPPIPSPLEAAPAGESVEEPKIFEKPVVPPGDEIEENFFTLTPPELDAAQPPSSRIGNDTHDEIARLIADFELRRRGLSLEDGTGPVQAENSASPIGIEPAEPAIEAEEKEISEEEPEPEEYRIEPPREADVAAAEDEEIPEEGADPDGADERLPSLAGDTMDFQDEVMKKILPGLTAGPTMGIPETVSKLQDALPFTPLSDESEIEKELETIGPPSDAVVRKVDFRLDDFDLDKDLVRNDRDETEDEGDVDRDEEDEADDAGDEDEGGKIPARRPIVRLGFFRRVKALLFDLLIVAIFWTGATGLAAGFLSVPILDLVAAAAVPLALLFGALLTVYLFLFHFFLGETPGGRLVTPKDVSSTE